MSSTDSGIESENGHDGNAAAAPGRVADRHNQQEEPVDLNMQPAEPQPKEQEKTLTDHLNKRLLESFLGRLDAGGMGLPQGAVGHVPEEKEDNWEDSK